MFFQSIFNPILMSYKMNSMKCLSNSPVTSLVLHMKHYYWSVIRSSVFPQTGPGSAERCPRSSHDQWRIVGRQWGQRGTLQHCLTPDDLLKRQITDNCDVTTKPELKLFFCGGWFFSPTKRPQQTTQMHEQQQKPEKLFLFFLIWGLRRQIICIMHFKI